MKTLTTLFAVILCTLSMRGQEVCDSMQVQGTFLEGNYLYLQMYNSSDHFIVYPYFTITMEDNAYITPADTLMVPSFLSTPSDANVGFTTGFFELTMLPANEVPQGTLFEGVLTITDPNDASFSCSFPFSFTYGSMIVGIEEEKAIEAIVYPNPASEVLHIQWASGQQEIKHLALYSALGTLVYQTTSTGASMNTMDITALAEGVFYMSIQTSAGNQITRTIIKN